MPSQTLSRRGFLARGSILVAGTALAGARAMGANERLSIGAIGCGGRSGALTAQIFKLSKAHNVEITAICDVYRPALDRAATRVKQTSGREPRRFTRFQALAALKDVDAVVIATPDYAHTPAMIAALEAGKDVYCEKPMSLEIPLANKALDMARAKKAVVQVGTQRRSEGRWHAAHDLLKTGILGHISRVDAANHFNQARWARGYAHIKKEDVDWEAFLFNRPMRPFDPKLLGRWHLYKDFTNGISGLWMAHLVDALHMVTGATYPRSAVAHGGTYVWKDGREHSDVFHALIDYPEDFLFSWEMSLTNSFGTRYTVHGTQGTLDMQTMDIMPQGGPKGTKVTRQRVPNRPNQDHMANWLECLRSRKRPNADIAYGHQHAVATIMAAAALHQGKRMVYDPEKREMTAG
jgi:predicted dehydrogenase